MARVSISYRRDDTSAHAGRLADANELTILRNSSYRLDQVRCLA